MSKTRKLKLVLACVAVIVAILLPLIYARSHSSLKSYVGDNFSQTQGDLAEYGGTIEYNISTSAKVKILTDMESVDSTEYPGITGETNINLTNET